MDGLPSTVVEFEAGVELCNPVLASDFRPPKLNGKVDGLDVAIVFGVADVVSMLLVNPCCFVEPMPSPKEMCESVPFSRAET